MAYKNFYVAIILRLCIIILLSMTLVFLYFERQSYYISLVLFLVLIAAVINIIRYFNNLNQWIALFLLGIENEDTTLKTPTHSGNKFIDDVYEGIERLNDLFKQTKLDISMQEQYYRMIINESTTGLLSVNEEGRVLNINPSAVKLTDLNDFQHINKLNSIDTALPGFILQSSNNLFQQSAIFENRYGQKLLFKLSEIKTVKEAIRVVAVSDITTELDNGAVDAWIKLARTLAHEIMNNITPITTLSQVITNYYIKDNTLISAEAIDSKTISNTVKGLRVIEEHSIGLSNFVNNYRKFTKLPTPQLKTVNLSSLIEENLIVAATFPNFSSITLKNYLPENIRHVTDEKLLSQVLINLLKNASEALIIGAAKKPEIILKLYQSNNTTKIEISNNGPSIPPEIREQIFVPFFTTKEEGSGVGLSLSKQIMLKMNGDILLSSKQEKLTTFIVVLN